MVSSMIVSSIVGRESKVRDVTVSLTMQLTKIKRVDRPIARYSDISYMSYVDPDK
jgi:hypothetical protein